MNLSFSIGPIIILIIFLVSILVLLRTYKLGKENVSNFLKDYNNEGEFEQLWKEYNKTFISDLNKTKIWSEEIFYIDSVYNTYFPIYKWKLPILEISRSIPNTLVGAGILGTFMGLAMGISGFDTSSAESITNSIDLLLNGIGTAFGTSITGILFSIIYNIFILKPTIFGMQEQCDRITKQLDEEFFIDEADYITTLFVGKDDEGNKLYPRLLFSKMAEELEQQSSSLTNFSTDLADSLKNISDTMLEKYNDEIYEMYKNILQPELEKLNKAIEFLYAEKRESASEVISEIIKDLQESMREMIGEFKSSISGDTKNELKDLSVILSDAGSSFAELPNLISSHFGEIQRNQENQMIYLDEIINSNTRGIEAFRTEIDKTFKAIAELNTSHTLLNKVTMDFQDVSNSIQDTTQMLNESTKESIANSLEITERNNVISFNLKNTTDSLENVTESFSSVDESLGGVFDQLSSGLNDYRDNVQKSLETYLYKYSDSISEYAEKLASAAESVKDGVEDLNDVISAKKELDRVL